MWLTSTVPTIADVASLMLVAAMCIELVIAVKTLTTETTLRMAFETRLIHGARVVISVLFVLAEFGLSEKLMLVGEDLFVPRAEIAGDVSVDKRNMMDMTYSLTTWLCDAHS